MNILCEPPSESLRHSVAGTTKVCRMDPLNSPEWDTLVARHSDASVFHTSAWARVLHQTYGHQPFYLACHQDGRLAALVPMMEVRSLFTGKRGVAVPFADFCGPLLFEGCNHGLVMDALTGLAAERRWHHMEFRGGEPLQPNAAPSISFYSHTLDLTKGPQWLSDELDGSVRRAIRKAERSGLVTEMRSDEAAILSFYRLHGRTRRRHGLPPQPLAFFRNIHREIIGRGMGSVVLVSRGATPVAASIFFHTARHAVYKFGACDERLQELRANNLAMWAGIRFLAERGCESLHFGRTSASHDGLRRFKLGWGATEAPLHYFRYEVRSSAWSRSRDSVSGSHNVVFSRLPLAVNRLLGGVLYPHLD